MVEMRRQLLVQFLIFLQQEQVVPIAEKVSKVCDLFKRYFHCQPISGQLLPTDANPADGHLTLAGHILLDDDPSVDEQSLTLAIIALEKCLESSPSNHSVKLLLMSLYSYIGAVSSNQRVYESLDVKYIQNDTLGYMATTLASSCGHYQTALTLYNNSLKFYNLNSKDVSFSIRGKNLSDTLILYRQRIT